MRRANVPFTYTLIFALLLIAQCLLMVTPSWAYIVVLKDGEQINTTKKYELRGDQVILALQSGTTASYDASDVDFPKTEEVNKGVNLSKARLIEGSQSEQLQEGPNFENSEMSLSELVADRPVGLALPERKLRTPGAAAGGERELPTTAAGFVDLTRMRRDQISNEALLTDLTVFFKGIGHDGARVYVGTKDDRPMVELVAASEASVFKSLRDTANGLLQVGPKHGLSGIDLLLTSDTQVRAGQFSLTVEQAEQLASGGIEPQAFFLRYVEF